MTSNVERPDITPREGEWQENEEYRNSIESFPWIKEEFSVSQEVSWDEFGIDIFLKELQAPWYCVFINGVWIPSLCRLPEGCSLLSQKEAAKWFGAFLKIHSTRWNNLQSPFHLKSRGGFQAFLDIPGDAEVFSEIQIVHFVQEDFLADGEKRVLLQPSLLVVIADGVKASLSLKTVLLGKGAFSEKEVFINGLFHFVVGIRASLQLVLEKRGKEVRPWWHEAWSLTSVLKQDAKVLTRCVIKQALEGSLFIDNRSILEGARASSEFLGVVESPKNCLLKVAMEHEAVQTESWQTLRSLLEGQANFAFEGDIVIRESGERSQAYQRHDCLLLSEEAVVKTMPRLQILTDDVKASHGATVGNLDPSVLFFMRSRGISEIRAKELFLQGFLNPSPVKVFE